MRALSTRIHSIVDYVFALILLVLPLVAGIDTGSAGTWVPVILGLVLVGYSLMTDYEFSLRRGIDPQVHLWLDGGLGLLLATSPWLLGFDRDVWLPHLVLGLLFAAVALFSHTIPSYDRRGGDRSDHARRPRP